MAAAYASLLSLSALLDTLQNHPNPPITLHQHHLHSLSKHSTFLQHFLHLHSNDSIKRVAADEFASLIADASNTVQDLIDSHVVDRILSVPNYTTHQEMIHLEMENAIKNMDVITNEAMVINMKLKVHDNNPHVDSQLIWDDDWKLPSLVGSKNVIVGFDGVLNDVVEKLIGDQTNCRVISLVGMGGIGKTTLATDIYEHQELEWHFDISAWVTISRNYNVRRILLKLVLDLNKKQCQEELQDMSEQEIGHKLYKSLYGRRYFIVLDDVWSVDVWDEMNRFFPDVKNKSRILLTTRLTNVASKLSLSNDIIEIRLLDDQESWNLLCQTAFRKEVCPKELEEIGRKIAKNCNGLPPSLTIVGRLLAKFKQKDDWVSTEKRLNSDLNLEYEKHCLHIIRTSYDHLPIHLKPCFLYMGVFPEDHEVNKSVLIQLWVAEGFVKPVCGKSLESIAEEYLMDLIDRNLILIGKLGSSGKIKFCKIHDLPRDLCIRESEKEKFLCTMRRPIVDTQQTINVKRCIAIHRNRFKDEFHLRRALDALQASSNVRSLICEKDVPVSLPRMLRVLNVIDSHGYDRHRKFCYFEDIFELVNLRFIAFNLSRFSSLSSLTHHWNLQSLILRYGIDLPLEIWKMFQLRHVKVWTLQLTDPSTNKDHATVLQNLQTLSFVKNFVCDREVIKRLPNVRKLKILYNRTPCSNFSQFCLSNLGCLLKLESLFCAFYLGTRQPTRMDFLQNVTFPRSLVKLKLMGTHLQWEDVTTTIGSLPNLQVLKLVECVEGPEWNLVEGKFLELKYLLISFVDLQDWTAEGSPFARLDHLCLMHLFKLKEIPSSIGDAPNLHSIKLFACNNSALNSAQKIVDEQAEFGNTALKVRVCKDLLTDKYVELRPKVEDG